MPLVVVVVAVMVVVMGWDQVLVQVTDLAKEDVEGEHASGQSNVRHKDTRLG